jgi:hypothetical protein
MLAAVIALLSTIPGAVHSRAAGPVSHFVVSAPAMSTAGSALTITVTALDMNGMVVTGYTGTVHIVASDSQATVPADYAFISGDQGVHTFTNGVTLRTAGTDEITVTDTSNSNITGSAIVNVSPIAPSVIRIFIGGFTTPGDPIGIDEVVLDQYGNTVTTYTGTIHFTSSDPTATLPADYTFTSADNGFHFFPGGVVLRTVGTQTVTETDTSNASLNGSGSVLVNPKCPQLPTRNVVAGQFLGHQSIGILDELAITTNSGVCMLFPGNGTFHAPPTPELWSTVPFYGTRATLAADVNGDGLADLIAVNDDSVWVMLSTGKNFSAPMQWSSQHFFGSQTTLIADIAGGYGKASLIAVNDTSTWVMNSTGTGFSAPTKWSSVPFFGSRGTFAQDLVMQGKSALIAVDDSGIWVMTSTGTSFNAPTAWWTSPFYGSVATLVPEDGVIRLIAVNGNSQWVMYSTGTGFSAPTLASSNPFYGTVATLAAVVSAGGAIQDLVAVNSSSIWVAQSFGATFRAPTEWSNTVP